MARGTRDFCDFSLKMVLDLATATDEEKLPKLEICVSTFSNSDGAFAFDLNSEREIVFNSGFPTKSFASAVEEGLQER